MCLLDKLQTHVEQWWPTVFRRCLQVAEFRVSFGVAAKDTDNEMSVRSTES